YTSLFRSTIFHRYRFLHRALEFHRNRSARIFQFRTPWKRSASAAYLRWFQEKEPALYALQEMKATTLAASAYHYLRYQWPRCSLLSGRIPRLNTERRVHW